MDRTSEMDSLEHKNHLKDTDSGVSTLSAKDIDNLQWAKEFMERYERKKPKMERGLERTVP